MGASYKTAFGSYIKAEDLKDRAIAVTVENVDLEDVGKDGKKEMKLVAHFRGKDKTLILNRTNADSMAEIFHTDSYDGWRGQIVLYPDTTMYGGKKVACVRLRSPHAGPLAQQTSGNPGTAPAQPTFQPATAFSAPPVAAAAYTGEAITDDDIPFAWLLPLMVPALALLGSISA